MSTDVKPAPISKSESRTKLRKKVVGRYAEILSRDAFWARCEITDLLDNHLTVQYANMVMHQSVLCPRLITERIPLAGLKRMRLYRK